MGVAMLQVFGLVLTVCAFACSLVIQGFAVPSVGKGIPGNASTANAFISSEATPLHLPYGTGLQPPLIIPPLESAPAPQTMKGFSPSVWSSPASPPNLFVSPPAHNKDSVPSMTPIPSGHCPSTALAPAPSASPLSSSQPNKQPHPRAPESMPPNTYKTQAPVNNAPLSVIAPGSNVPAPRGRAQSLPPSHSIFQEVPPSLPPVVLTRPALPGNSTSVKPIQSEPPSSPPEQIASRILAPPPRISRKKAAMPIAALANQTACHHAPVSHSLVEAPTASNHLEHNSVPRPCLFSKSTPGSRSPTKHHHAKVYKIASAPLLHAIPPTSASSSSEPPISSPLTSSDYHYSPIPTPPPSASEQAKIPIVSPKMSPFGSAPRRPRMPLSPPFRALPPPPPQKDCAPTTCIEPLTYGPPESPCICVLPIQVGLRLTVALYTFFPLVSELAAEISAGVFMKQSQVRIMGANAAGDDPDKAIILIDLLPLGEKFDDTTAYLTFQRFWNKQVVIKASFFGDYHVLYVRYPGLPPSPPLPPSSIGIIASKPYPGHDNNARSMQPLGVDISRHQHKHGPRGSILAIIILSCFVALLLLCSGLWALIFRHRNCVFQPGPTPPTTIQSLAKSSGIPISMVGSGTSSPSFSLVSSIAAYTGSAKTFSSSDIEKATDFFNETRIIGEGGFGRVYSGVLEDGTKVAMKILKRYDQQGGREFLAEVEMLCRLHHRNLVKLIGICIEDRTRCLVYELIPNGSVESHLHGFHKERSSLDWNARLKIALGAARALAYLHEDSSPRVIHRDFKASNILLEDDFTPKVSDFGLARAALDEGNRHISTRVMGTFGYVAPEYAMTGHLLVKSDVYSYGVVLLELLTGRKPVDMSQPPGQENLVSWARPLLTSKDGLESIVDPSLGPDISSDSIAKVAAIASMCVEPEVSHRPFMGEVVQALKLVCRESDEMKDTPSRSCSQEDLSITTDARNSTNSVRLAATLLTPSSVSDYDYCVDVERDLSMSELLSSCPKFSPQDSESFRRYSSSGPLRTSKPKPLWKTMRQLSRGSVSEHSMLFKLWPGSH